MDDFSFWLQHHGLTTDFVNDIIQARNAGALAEVPAHWSSFCADQLQDEPAIDRQHAFDAIVRPALCELLDPSARRGLDPQLGQVLFDWRTPDQIDAPHTFRHPDTRTLHIVMAWQGTPNDLLCLAHETAHAAQMILSNDDHMPPVARETCAFLGELCVMQHVYHYDRACFQSLMHYWFEDNGRYFGRDCAAIVAGLKAPQSPYHYRLNYPLARLSAVCIFNDLATQPDETVQRIKDMFASGKNGMTHLPLETLAGFADALENYLPPFPRSEPSALTAYQSIGAMALLDIDFYQGRSEQKIGDYYQEVLENLQKQTAFVALRQDQRPIGYATWQSDPQTNQVTLTHQTAPFGDHLALQRTLRQRFGANVAVCAHHSRSARKEQVTWQH